MGAADQFRFLVEDVGVIMNWTRYRWLTCWLHRQFWAVVPYRIERALYLVSGDAWPILRYVTAPIFGAIRLATVDIRPEAHIGPGLRISHPSLGIVISRHAVIGRHAVLTGGNCVGIRREFTDADRLVIGDHVDLGANASVLGPVTIGDYVRVGAGAIVTRDVPHNGVVRMSAPMVYESS